MQSLGGSKEGKCDLKYKDGGHYTFQNPTMSIEGILKTNKTQIFYDKAIIQDELNGMRCEIQYNPSFNKGLSGTAYRYTLGWIPRMNNLGKNEKGSRSARSDDIDIKIYESRDSTEPICEGHGSWLSHLIIDD